MTWHAYGEHIGKKAARGTGHAERAHRERQREARRIAARINLGARHAALRQALRDIVAMKGPEASARALEALVDDDRRGREA